MPLSILNGRRLCPSTCFCQTLSKFNFHLCLQGEGGGGWGIKIIHVAFDLIKVQELTNSNKKNICQIVDVKIKINL